MDKKMHLLLIGLCLFIYTVHGTLPKMSVAMNYVSWFCVIYFIAAYLRLYPGKYSTNLQFWRGGVILCLTLSVSSILGALWLNDRYGTNIWQYGLVADSNALTAVASFMYSL